MIPLPPRKNSPRKFIDFRGLFIYSLKKNLS
jgi:hypothetical protein